jgi:Xaa-Pro aminopeptidase
VLGYGVINRGNAILFIDKTKFDAHDISELHNDGVNILPYEQFYPYIANIQGERILIDPARTNFLIEKILKDNNHICESVSIPNLLKSRKNKTEIEGLKKANITDGIALLDFILWIENNIGKTAITEWNAVLKLDECRSKRPGYKGPSFYPIVAYKDHGAIVHITVTETFANKLEPEGVLLVDSGGQYDFGTIDTTRTFALGPVSEDIIKDFTLILKGFIALSTARFPKGTIGCHLDVLVRNHLWRNHLNYGHGTSHGVGSFLNVHEGPISIRQDLNNQPICPGNVLSVEPGIYRTGKYGIRTENVIVCVEDTSSEFGDFLKFETLTMFPIDTTLIDKTLLDKEEVAWLNNFHSDVLKGLSPHASPEQLVLLKRMTNPILK